MSKIPLRTYQRNGAAVVKHLSPFCDRIEIAGSVRRGKPFPKDIEIVCLPKLETRDLFGLDKGPVSGFIEKVNSWKKVRGEPTGKYTQRILPTNLVLDLFIVEPENFGMQLLIRTGPAKFSSWILSLFKERGYRSEGAYPIPVKGGPRLEFPEEEEIFSFLEMEFIRPEDRAAAPPQPFS